MENYYLYYTYITQCKITVIFISFINIDIIYITQCKITGVFPFSIGKMLCNFVVTPYPQSRCDCSFCHSLKYQPFSFILFAFPINKKTKKTYCLSIILKKLPNYAELQGF